MCGAFTVMNKAMSKSIPNFFVFSHLPLQIKILA